MNTGYIHSSGAVIVEPIGQQLVITVTKKGVGIEPITITSVTPAALVTSQYIVYMYTCIIYMKGSTALIYT